MANISPLSYINDYEAFLSEQHYAPNTIRQHKASIKRLLLWLEENKKEFTDINEETVSQYVSNIRQTGNNKRSIAKIISASHHLLFMLRKHGIIKQPLESPINDCDRWLDGLDNYLCYVVGLAETTRQKYFFFIRKFLHQFCGTESPDWTRLRADDIATFIQNEASRLENISRSSPSTAIRAMLRYLVYLGEINQGMVAATPVMRRWRHAGLPKYLASKEVERIVAGSLDSRKASLRNHAILLMLARLGLRANEVLKLSLDDIDWNDGFVLIRAGKTHRERKLPLSIEVGEALLKYLQLERPRSSSRRVFLNVAAPFKPLCDSSAISKIVKRSMVRVGVKNNTAAAHLLRHSAATDMLVKGAFFKDIADILGHQSLQTTAIYAKLDINALSQVALPWPGGDQ